MSSSRILPGALLLNTLDIVGDTCIMSARGQDGVVVGVWGLGDPFSRELALLITEEHESHVRQIIITARCVGWAWVVDGDLVANPAEPAGATSHRRP